SFRRHVATAALAAGRALGWLCIQAPRIVLQQPLVRSVLASRAFALFKQFLLKPMLWTVPLAGVLNWLLGNRWTSGGGSLAWFVGVAVLLNSRLGRDLEETATDWFVRTWKQIHSDFLPGIFWFVMGIFKRCLDGSERLLYAVDEWLRFRAGDGRWTL